jgi:hypothetical protein
MSKINEDIHTTDCARAQFSGCRSTTNAHSETGLLAVCCQNLTPGAVSSRSALSLLVGALFKRFGFFLNTPRTPANRVQCAFTFLSKTFFSDFLNIFAVTWQIRAGLSLDVNVKCPLPCSLN